MVVERASWPSSNAEPPHPNPLPAGERGLVGRLVRLHHDIGEGAAALDDELVGQAGGDPGDVAGAEGLAAAADDRSAAPLVGRGLAAALDSAADAQSGG